ncbi:uncharacterized protein LOC142359438 isoform X3 [Opisthocomus hoazin]|uniref:uncharacterized protein LOC142359438 isoform X3 n=1 Tax=Opisthocomus hoazin TaxID=30419 RepID=UPI003F52F17F
MEGHQAGSCLALQAGESLPLRRTAKRPELRKRKGGEQGREASEAAESPGSAESESCGGGQPSDRRYGRGVQESRREKRLKRQSLPAAPRARAALPVPIF